MKLLNYVLVHVKCAAPEEKIMICYFCKLMYQETNLYIEQRKCNDATFIIIYKFFWRHVTFSKLTFSSTIFGGLFNSL